MSLSESYRGSSMVVKLWAAQEQLFKYREADCAATEIFADQVRLLKSDIPNTVKVFLTEIENLLNIFIQSNGPLGVITVLQEFLR